MNIHNGIYKSYFFNLSFIAAWGSHEIKAMKSGNTINTESKATASMKGEGGFI